MGLFDRIKKAFTGNNEKDKEEETKKVDQESAEQATEQTETESTEAPKSADESEGTTEPTEKASDEVEKPETSEPETAETNKTDSQVSEEKTEDTQSTADSDQTDVEPEVTQENETQEKSTDETVEQKTEPEATPVEEKTEPDETPDESEEETEDKSSEAVEEQVTSAEDEVAEDESETEEGSADDEASEVKEYDEGLKKSRTSFSARFNKFLANFRSVDEEFFDDLEELLIESDVGYETALRISDELREEVKLRNAKKRSDVSDVIVEKLVDMYDEEGKEEDNALHFSQDDMPTVFLFVGVNGAGKTTTIGKLAHRFQSQGKKVLLAAGDTFRAGAIEQLQRWGERVNVPVEAKAPQTDPASVVYDALHRAINEKFDILLVDTAGRLQNNQNLMRELEKIKRVISREIPEAPQEVLLVLDGSTGQNALSQAKQFKETTDVSGIVLTKLDGSSQGGIVLAIRNELHLPVKLVGLGEQMDDLRDFDAEKFIYGLFKDLIVGSGD
ncbi:signal recognition particle-docking protein FtsY [Companilactobacillus zhongbaensis]|uniref:signal recognition particle-docking protein FtsY n=1 Tax=Companilactobacillus zhongbaensis TaxID=2486009 RepID=UPI000F76C3E7|nr:signal recognition particle-docking protein FtsY [Companilactobacillus zhongbaensis]